MALLDEIRAERLIQLARQRFDSDLAEAELRVLRDSASSEDLPEPEETAAHPEIRSALIRWLATDPETAAHIDPRGIRAYSVTVPTDLDLWECRVHSALFLDSCIFQGEVSIQSAETRGILLSRSSFEMGIRAGLLVAHGSLWLSRIRSAGKIELIGARIDGDLDLSGARLTAEGFSLIADRSTIGGAAFFHGGFESSGEVRLADAQIASDLICYGARLDSTREALTMIRANIGGSVYLTNGFESSGTINFSDAQIKGSLNCSEMKLTASHTALNLNGASVGGWAYI